MDAFTKTELFSSVAPPPNLANPTSADYAAMEVPTRVTRGLFSSNWDPLCLSYGRRVSLQGGVR